MIKFEYTQVVGFEPALRGMRNAKNSWSKADSEIGCNITGSYQCKGCEYKCVECEPRVCIGPNDLDLACTLVKAGTDHRKFLRMIVVYVDITAPLYWWKQFDTYKVGTVANSCSTMHKIHDKEFTIEDFSCEHLVDESIADLEDTIITLNKWRNRYLVACKTEPETGLSAKDIWWQMIQLLPTSYNQKRTVMLTYEVLANMYKSRNSHKLDEWKFDLCNWIMQLPYNWFITGKRPVIEEKED